jgi:hypothetical protein
LRIFAGKAKSIRRAASLGGTAFPLGAGAGGAPRRPTERPDVVAREQILVTDVERRCWLKRIPSSWAEV